MDIKLKIKGTNVKIYINDLLHLSFVQSEYRGVQSWKEGTNWYCIEYYFKDSKPIKCEYDSFEKWKTILELIDKEL